MIITLPINLIYYNLNFYLLCIYLTSINDLLFFIKSHKHPSPHFDINNYITFSHSVTRSSSNNKLLYLHSTCNSDRHFYFCRLPRLWNTLPQINLDSPINIIISIKFTVIYGIILRNILRTIVLACTFQLVCPCNNCVYKLR